MKQFTLTHPHPGVLRATFDRPPINLLNDETVEEVGELADLIEQDPGLKVLVIDSTNPDFFMARYDVSDSAYCAG
jgi:enoyl-CoA hydratase/carnithine racemase